MIYEEAESKNKASPRFKSSDSLSPSLKPFPGFIKSLEAKNAFYEYKRSSNWLYSSSINLKKAIVSKPSPHQAPSLSPRASIQ